MATSPIVENLPIPAEAASINPAFLASHQKLSEGVLRQAAAAEAIANIGEGGRQDRFTGILKACIMGRVATDVEGFLTFARELCDGIDREFSTPAAPL